MPYEEPKPPKRHPEPDPPFPWTCRHCGKAEVVMGEMTYPAQVRYEGHVHSFTIPQLKLPRCQSCGEGVFNNQVFDQVNTALRSHLKLLAPGEIRDALRRLDLSEEEAALQMGIAAEMLSFWLDGVQVQSRAMDNLMRVFFAFPQVRSALSVETHDAKLGFVDIVDSPPPVPNLANQ